MMPLKIVMLDLSILLVFFMVINHSPVSAEECDPRNANLKGTYCTDRKNGWDGGVYVLGQGCLSSASAGSGCDCDCYKYDAEMRKCKSTYDSNKNFCYTREVPCASSCPFMFEIKGCGCNPTDWTCSSGYCVVCPDNTYYIQSEFKCENCKTCRGVQYKSSDCYRGTEGTDGMPGHDTVCSDCPAGSICNSGNKQPCPVGSYCTAARNSGVVCYTSQAEICRELGLSAPISGCETGHYFSPGTCTPCLPGTYLAGDVHQISSCTVCPAGKFQASSGSTACISCGLGSFSEGAGSTGCRSCNSGSYQSNPGQTACIGCSKGSFAPDFGSSLCTPCAAGTYSAVASSSACILCKGRQYSDVRGATTCTTCQQNMTIFQKNPLTGYIPIVSLQDSSVLCDYCPAGRYTCNCDQNDPVCIENSCENDGLCPACSPLHYCPEKGQKLKWTQHAIGDTYIFRQGNGIQDRVLAKCSRCLEETQYANPVCTDTNAVCKNCTRFSPLITYISQQCTATLDAITTQCNISNGDLRSGIGICNVCPAGSTFTDEIGCQHCVKNTFSKYGQQHCTACPVGTGSGPGASTCTVVCPVSGSYSPSGLLSGCIPIQNSTRQNIIAQWSKLMIVEFGAQLANGSMVVATNSANGNGILWIIGMDQAWIIFGDDGVVERSLGKITSMSLLPTTLSSQKTIVVADVRPNETGRIQYLTYDFSKGQIVKIVRLNSQNILLPSGIVVASDGSIFVADAAQHCIFKLQYSTSSGYSQVLWRGTPGSNSLSNIRNKLNVVWWLLTRPQFMVPFPGSNSLMIVMDDAGIWTFQTDQPISNTNSDLSHICGGMSNSTSVLLLCSQINFQTLGVTGLVATQNSLSNVVILVSFRTSDEKSGILSLTQNINAFFEVKILISGFSPVTPNQQFPTSLFLGINNHGIFVTLGGNIAQVVEIGMQACLCDAGLYCDVGTQSCVQSPVGSYSPSWSTKPTPCKIGYISGGPGGKDEASWCRPCGRKDFTTNKEAALSCEPMCTLNMRFSAEAGQCVEGCDPSTKGEYLDVDEVSCHVCPIGSGAVLGSVGKGITAGCPPCSPTFKSTRPGICEPCPSQTTTIFFGSTICMPSSSSTTFVADGLLPVLNAAKSYPVFSGLSAITSMSVTSGGSLFIAATNQQEEVVWRLDRAKTLVANVSYTSGGMPLSLIEVSDDGTTLFSTQIGATCIWKIPLNVDGNSTQLKPWAGICGLSGDNNGQNDVARLGYISSITLMHVEGHTPVLFASTRSGLGSGCTSIRSISLYDGSISTFLSYNQLQFPFVLVPICHDLEFKLSIPRGTDKIFYSNGGDVALVELYGGNQSLNGNYGLTASLIFSLNGQGTVHSMASKADGTLLILKKVESGGGGDLIIIGPRIWTNGISELVNTVDQVAAAGGMLACAGQHIWYTDTTQKAVIESNYAVLSGCVGGFVLQNNVCMQVGIGQYSTPDGHVQNCRGGTYGTVGGSLHISCKECPPGSISKEGALICELCPAAQPFASHGSTECAAACPISTYLRDGVCVSCPAGFFGPIGAISSDECTPCDAGYYSNETTGGLCLKCPHGWSSVSGGHMCVVVCSADQCASDGVSCKPLTSNWELVTSIFIPQGFSMRAVAVSRGGGVFYSDNNVIQYFLDDCPAHVILDSVESCPKEGVDILPPLCSGCSRGISAMVVTQEFVKGTSHRYLYAASIQTHNIYRFPIAYAQGIVDADATLKKLLSDSDSTTAAFSAAWLVIGNVNGMSGFADGPFLNFAKFNMPMELEISQDDRFLIISDFSNNRIRLADFKFENVSTILGTGSPCWRRGTTSACPSLVLEGSNTCNIPSCASSKTPIGIGLSATGETLFVVMNGEDSIASLSGPLIPNFNREFSSTCALSLSKAASGSIETCQTSTDQSKSCMLYQPYDVIAASNSVIYVSVRQGITRIDLNSMACQQIAGSYWDFTRTSRGSRDGAVDDTTQTSDARVNQPFRLALAKDRAILYVADMNNGALRRVFLGGQCRCPAGSIFLPESSSCYNPSQKWSTRTLVSCPEGQFALEGESVCTSCTDAEVYGIRAAAVSCIVWANTKAANANMREKGFTYAMVIGSPQNPLHNVVGSDWYGSGYITSPSWDDIFRMDSIVKYSMGRAAGHAPWGGEFGSYTYNAEFKTWALEENPILKPNLILPGFWHPCSPTNIDSRFSVCECTNQVASFDVEQVGGKSSSPWHNIRMAAFEAGAKVLMGGSILTDYASGVSQSDDESAVSLWSRFMILGSDLNSPTVCPVVGGSGPCFPAFQHVKTSVVPLSTSPQYVRLDARDAMWSNDGITTLTCATGWPAHYFCPNGYTWVAPNSSRLDPSVNVILNQITSQIACLSCIPGSFSFMDIEVKKITGGPYSCSKCIMGTFNSAVGSTFCTQCPSGTYSSMHGATSCSNCPENYWTSEGAQTINACSPCPPGSGSCKTCVFGEYQSMSAQAKCIKCPPGQVSTTVNQTTCTPCSPQTFQSSFGMAFCNNCPHGSYTENAGATACTTCEGTAACKLIINGVCGQGCGLNFYYDEYQCKRCPLGYLNANNPCSQSITSCYNPMPGKYATENTLGSGGDVIAECPYGFGPDAQLRGCTICSPGTHAVLGKGICEKCSSGYFSSQNNQSSCSSCPPGSFAADPGQSSCLLCERGYHSPNAASVICTQCSPGHYASSSGSVFCTPCINGTYQNINASISQCEECNAVEGFYSGSAATACRFCEGGYVNLSQSSSCVGCGLGMYEYEDEHGTRKCKQCGAGLVNLYERFAFNETFCQPCPSNLDYSPANLSADYCFTAPPGNMPTLPLKTWFTPCLPGTYRSPANLSCLPCKKGYVALAFGLQECQACIPGTYASDNGQKCIGCDNGLFSGDFAATQCISCPAGSISSDSNAACVPCPANSFQIPGGPVGVCQPCEYGMVSAPGSTSCQLCPKWTIYFGDEKVCSGCKPGKYMVYESAAKGYVCLPCKVGTQNPLSGANSSSACMSCGAGFIPTSYSAATGCMTCPLGQMEVNNISCEKCAAGTSGTNGVICSSCGIGNYASSVGASACVGCSIGMFSDSTGTSHCSLCQKGTFSNVSGPTACLTCTSAEDGYAPTTGSSFCVSRTKSCNPLYYLKLKIETPDQDNECVYCSECAPDEYVIPTQDDDYLQDLVLGAGRLLNSCPGNTTSLGYRCLKNEPVLGMFLSDRSRAGSSGFSSSSGVFQDQSVCTDLTPEHLLTMDYVLGPTSDCYVGCRYGIVLSGNLGGVYAYLNLYGRNAYEAPMENIFYPRLAAMASEVCAHCPLSPCPFNTYRPEYLPGCGPPCGLYPYKFWCVSSNHVNNQGCFSICKDPPLGAVTSGGSVSGLGTNSSCPWTCLHEWHLNEDGTGCTPCSTNICESGFVLVSQDQCLTHHTKADLCKPCPRIEGGNAVGWNADTSTCIYSCFTGYYYGLQKCISCTSLDACPVGTFRNVEDCINKGVEPVCLQCKYPQDISVDLISFTSDGGFSATNCSGLCRTGYHTIDKNTDTYISNTLGLGIPALSISCRVCVVSESRPCNGKCSSGYFRNTSVISDTLPGSCVKCVTNQECGIGKYAPTCSGNGTANVGCHTCSPSLLIQNGEILRQFVPYEDQIRFITTGIVMPSAPFACPSACIPNFIQDLMTGGGTQCISCKVYVKDRGCKAETMPLSSYAPMQPTPCDFVYSHWNATPSLVWWDNTPSFLPSSFSKGSIKSRAGICWACPMGTGTLQQDPDLCLLLPGYGRPSATPLTERIAIPILGPDLYLTFQEPRPLLINLLDSSYVSGGSRRLLSSTNVLEMEGKISILLPRAAAESVAVAGGVLCPIGAYKSGRGLANCMACPYGTSTISSGSTLASQCLCNTGWYRVKSTSNNTDNYRMECIPCSVDTFRPAATIGEEGCLSCPPNETTHGRINSTACSCRPGFMRNYKLANRPCVPCAAGTYCAPCFEGQRDCPLEGVQSAPCFAQSTSPPGSTSIKNCSCLSGLVPLTRTTNKLAYYCAPVPPNAIYDQVSKMVKCKLGWTEEWSFGQLLGCTLCPMGYFADADPSIASVLAPICRPCPKGTFAASKDVIGNCTPCLSPQTTLSEASKSPESCGCPLPTSKGPDGYCIGCLSNQYIQSGVCINCPSFSISKIGATSQTDCLCMPGYGIAAAGSCMICDVGKYSSSASNSPCKTCPEGSTTKSLGSKSVRNCGATADLCLAGYTMRTNLGCILTSLIAV